LFIIIFSYFAFSHTINFTASHSKGCSGRKELLLVLEQDLLLVPFSMLHPKIDDCSSSGEYLIEKFSLLVTPSLIKFKENQRLVVFYYCLFSISTFFKLSNLFVYRAQKKAGVNESSSMSTLVVGNPLLPKFLNEQLNLNELPHTEQEASMVAEMLLTKPLIKAEVDKI